MTSPLIIEEKLKDLKPLLQELYSVDEIGFFGSYAMGNYSASSDIDILVSFKKPLGWSFFDLKEFLEEKLGHKVDLVPKNALKQQLRSSILEQVRYV